MAKSVSFSPAQGTVLIRGATILFEPSNFDENNNPRKNIVLAVDEETIETVRAWEEQIDSDKLSSNISKYGLRAKICMDTVRAWEGKKKNAAARYTQGSNCKRTSATHWHLEQQTSIWSFSQRHRHRIY